MTLSAVRLAKALVPRFNSVIPTGFTTSAAGGTLELHSPGSEPEVVDIGNLIAIAPESRTQAVATVLAAVNQVQDCIAVELRSPWPGQSRMPLASADADAASINVEFEEDGVVLLRLEPIAWDEIETVSD
jgi:hypothetical protein